MPFKFNPFSGNFDQTGSGGGGASYIDGEVQNFSALPQTVGSPAVDSAYLVREAEGAWLISRKPAGIYIRTANTGTRANDWTYAGEFPDVFNDANLVVYNNTDSTKNAKFDVSAVATATTRTITVPDKNITLDDAGDSRTPTAHAASHNLDGSDEIVVESLATATGTAYHALVSTGQYGAGTTYGLQMSPAVLGAGALYQSDDLSAHNVQLSCSLAGTWTVANSDNLRTAISAASDSHTHGNLTNDGKIGSTSGLPLVTTTAGAITTLALGTANQVLRVNSGASGVEFADPAASGVTGAAASASDVLGVSGSDITGVDANADRIVFWDDSASALKYLEVSTGLSLSGTTLTATASGGSKTYAVFTAEHNQPPSTAFATLDTRNSIAVLDFDAAADENAVFVGIMPEAASLGSGLIVRLHWMATTATSGNVRWGVQFERSNTDLDADSFDTAVEATAATNGTSGIITTTAITVTTIDGITAGDVFRLKVFRNADDATNDTMTGDAELVAVEVRSAA